MTQSELNIELSSKNLRLAYSWESGFWYLNSKHEECWVIRIR